MEILILSCGTGGGHNSAAQAVQEELLRRGHGATLLNPFDLCGGKIARRVDNTYINLAQTSPRGFGAVYALGNAYRRLPWRPPVYYANGYAADALGAYLDAHPVDAIVTTHVFPAEMLTYLRNHGRKVPKTVFIATDYTCIPFTEECDCDICVIPSPMLSGEFVSRGIPQEKLFPLGIPVRSAFRQEITREKARRELGLLQEKRYLLLSGGSIGGGKLEKAVELLYRATRATGEQLIVICGSNASLCKHLEGRYADRVTLMGKTDRMAEYLRACDLYFTKPGGLSTTEAAVMEVPLALLPPIPGCETHNRNFFTRLGLAVEAQPSQAGLENILSLLTSPEKMEHMRQCQRSTIPKDAAQRICDLLEPGGWKNRR